MEGKIHISGKGWQRITHRFISFRSSIRLNQGKSSNGSMVLQSLLSVSDVFHIPAGETGRGRSALS